MKKLVLLFCIIFCSIYTFGQKVPSLIGRVNDYGNVFSPNEKTALEYRLKVYEDSTSNQIVVLTLPRLNDKDSASLFDECVSVFKEWKIGQKGKNNGVLLVVVKNLASKNGPGIRIAVGKGLEGALTDMSSGIIIEHDIRPMVTQGKYYEGVNAGITSMILVIDKEFSADHSTLAWWEIALLIILVIIIIIILLRCCCSDDDDCCFIACLDCDSSDDGGSDSDCFSGGGGEFGGGGAGD